MLGTHTWKEHVCLADAVSGVRGRWEWGWSDIHRTRFKPRYSLLLIVQRRVSLAALLCLFILSLCLFVLSSRKCYFEL